MLPPQRLYRALSRLLLALVILAPIAALDVAEGIAGLRWDMSTCAALKTEYRLARYMETDRTTHVVYTSWQFGL